MLDSRFIGSLGTYDYVYAWGVLHHTGNLYQALENLTKVVRPGGGSLFLAVYNRQPIATAYWTLVKKIYNKAHFLRPLVVGVHLLYPVLPSFFLRQIQRRQDSRGMGSFTGLTDWLGGYPFEVASPEEIFDYLAKQDFRLVGLRTVAGRHGCNEFVFQRE